MAKWMIKEERATKNRASYRDPAGCLRHKPCYQVVDGSCTLTSLSSGLVRKKEKSRVRVHGEWRCVCRNGRDVHLMLSV
jgi:hypothetical protein